jgi:hypothetical protein
MAARPQGSLDGAERLRAFVRAAAIATALSVCSIDASADTPSPSAGVNQPPVKVDPSAHDTVTVEARRNRAELKRKVKTFLSAIMARHDDWSIARWHEPVCPLVAGLPRNEGEFILARLSSIARAADVPLAPEKCTANFFVVVTPEPNELLVKWRHRDRRLFDNTYGEAKVRAFINTSRPIRVWFNAVFTGSDGMPFYADLLPAGASGGANMNTYPTNSRARGSRLLYDDVRALTTAIVVVDANRLAGVNLGELADYIAMTGLAEITLNNDFGDASTILQLFRAGAESRPEGLTVWDRAFLKSLYTTSQADVMQLSEMETAEVRYIEQLP